ncbi:MAG: Xaa-Pro peptidase family protein [Simkaniaceae bacterium]|nr:Xaa-Pro peptidase family protein [Simkaniaceae bacterium]
MAPLETRIQAIQNELSQTEIEGWLIYDFHCRNEIAMSILDIAKETHLTRPIFYWVPKAGEPILLLHRIEGHHLRHLLGKKELYLGYAQLVEKLNGILSGKKTVMMEMSEFNQIPYLGQVPAGVIDLIRSLNIKVVSSGDLLQCVINRWEEDELSMHRRAVNGLVEAYQEAFSSIRHEINRGKRPTEKDVCELISSRLTEMGLVFDGEPFCAVNANAANPHYQFEERGDTMGEGDLVLIDLWARENHMNAPYADITVMGFIGSDIPSKMQEVFSIVREAQKQTIALIQKKTAQHQPISGAEADRHCRNVIIQAGYQDYILHRTGHNIGVQLHGPGAHLDSFETVDHRCLLTKTCFSVEPGIYIPGEFGVRLEADVYIHEDGQVEVTTPIQDAFYLI